MMRHSALLLMLLATTLFAQDAALVWTVPGGVKSDDQIDFPIAHSSLVVNDRLIVTIFPPNYLLGSDDMHGKRLWRFPFHNNWLDDASDSLYYATQAAPRCWGNRTTSFATNDSRDIIACVDSKSGTMFAFDLKLDGKIKWRTFGHDSDDGSLRGFRSLGPPCIVDESAYCLVTSDVDFLCIGLDLSTGKLRSRVRLAASRRTEHTVRFSPVLAGTLLICPCPTNELVCVTDDGLSVEWRADLGTPLVNAFQLDATKHYVMILRNGVATCLDVADGKPKWTRDDLKPYPFVRNGDSQIVGTDDSLAVIDILTGNQRWIRSLASGAVVAANGTMHDDRLLIPMTDNTILQFDIQTGTQTASITSPRKLGHLFSMGGYIYSLTHSDLDKLSLAPTAAGEKAEP